MKYTVLSLFPDIVDAFMQSSIMAKAIERGFVAYQAVNIRNFAFDKHKTCDDAPYGGGAGMLMLPEPLGCALESVGVRNRFETRRLSGKMGGTEAADSACPVDTRCPPKKKVIYLTPSGKSFTQALAKEFATEQEELVLLCGRYEGIDQRIIDAYVDEEVSVGDYVLSSGEVAALAVIDATYRLIERVISPLSLEEESFGNGLLEYPQWTRPEKYGTLTVPDILLSGHHENIRRFRLRKRVEKTLSFRPDLIRKGLEEHLFDAETCKIIDAIAETITDI
ncbi:MAG: tRNA (guanosine(37)-N1)-methyltransferase TrmD [Treponema sp.]|nr:tRNA (guanosine(37)-N1)-methyltransferase TrmD [Treponema sp.]